MGCAVTDANVRHKLGEIRWELENLIVTCDKAIIAAKSLLTDAGIDPRMVNSPHIYESDQVKTLAQDLLRIHKGQYVWNLPEPGGKGC